MSEAKRLRKNLFVDPRVQGALIARVVLYWVLCLIGMTLMLLLWRTITGPAQSLHARLNEMWPYYEPALIASVLLLPLVIIDITRFSNQFVGPLVRLRRSMRELARGEHVEPIEFRGTDFWQEVADEFNAVCARVQTPATPPQFDLDKQEEDEEELAAVG